MAPARDPTNETITATDDRFTSSLLSDSVELLLSYLRCSVSDDDKSGDNVSFLTDRTANELAVLQQVHPVLHPKIVRDCMSFIRSKHRLQHYQIFLPHRNSSHQ